MIVSSSIIVPPHIESPSDVLICTTTCLENEKKGKNQNVLKTSIEGLPYSWKDLFHYNSLKIQMKIHLAWTRPFCYE